MSPYRVVASLAALMLLSACAGSGTSSGGTSSGPPLTGKRWCVSTPGAIGVLDQMFNNMVTAATKDGNGLQIDFVSGNFDFSKQLADTAQFVASGNCAAIGTITGISSTTAAGWQKAADDAKSKNIVFVNFSADWITDATQNFGNPHYPAGHEVGVAAGQWYMAHGGSGSVGVLTNPQSPGLMMRVKGFEEGFNSTIGSTGTFFEVATGVGGGVTESASATASLIQAHRDLKVMFGWGGDTWQGITQAAKEAGKNTNNFFVGADDIPDAAVNQFSNGTNGLLQAGTQFDYSLAGVAWERSVEWALLGAKAPVFGYVNPILIDKDNAAELVAANMDPLNPKYAHFYNEIIFYFSNPVKTGDPFPDATTGTHWPGVTQVPQKGTTPS